jgi:DNA-binding transcriptional regulator GbsR (MarR family)
MELDPKTREFLDRVARSLELTGVTRTGGRMFGLLLLSNHALSLDEIAATLGVSKPMVSTSARFYEQLGILQRTQRPGDRKHYYEILPGAFTQDARVWTEMMHAFIGVAETGLDLVDEDDGVARARLREMGAFYRHLAAAVEEALEQWNSPQAREARDKRNGES